MQTQLSFFWHLSIVHHTCLLVASSQMTNRCVQYMRCTNIAMNQQSHAGVAIHWGKLRTSYLCAQCTILFLSAGVCAFCTLTDPAMMFRCYELRCVNNVVPGNYSADVDHRPIPYAIQDGQLKPVYAFDTINGTPSLDDYNRPFPGNVLNGTKQLFTQCWNETDAQV